MLDSQGNPLKFGDEVLLHGQITGMSSRGDGSTIITVRGLDLGGKGRQAPIYAVASDIVRLFNSPAPAPAVATDAPAPISAVGSPAATPETGRADVSPAPAPAFIPTPVQSAPAAEATPGGKPSGTGPSTTSVAEPAVK